MIHFEYLWNIFWLVPLLIFWWHFAKERKAWVLLILFIVIDVILMKPFLVKESKSPVMVIIFDRSLSISDEQNDWARKCIKKALSLSVPDKIAVVTFGRNIAIEKWFDEDFDGEVYARYVNPESSALNDAILLGCSLVPTDKAGKILLLTDGEYRGVSPLVAATEALRRNIKIDLIKLNKTELDDVGVKEINLPIRVACNETFQFSVELFSSKDLEVNYELRRLGKTLSKGKVQINSGSKTMSFVDKVDSAGSFEYEFQIFNDKDNILQNNLATGILQVDGIEKILLLNLTGKPNNFSRALVGTGKDVHILVPKTDDITLGLLEGYQLIVLENVPADHFQEHELKAIQLSVEYYGKSLMMTGGRSSFGMGGYLNSCIEPILPIDMKAKDEKRQVNIGICLMLDRSGSMSVQVAPNKTKMDLADAGADATLKLLSSQDEISVIAVDSSPHIVIPMTKIEDNLLAFSQKILSIESMGGGIYSYTALKAGVKEINNSSSGTRHLILFADASDAEEYGDSVNLAKKLFETGITVSVVAMGKDSDIDAEFLKDVAKAGGGRIFFTEDVTSLPRLFTQDVVQVKRSSFEETKTYLFAGSGLSEMGNFPFLEIPSVDGVNLNYIKNDSQILYMCKNEYDSPGIATWNAGAGKVMAISFEVDGKFSGDFANWQKYDQFFAGLARFLIPRSKNSSAVLNAERLGHQVNIQLLTDQNEPVTEDFKTSVFYGKNLEFSKSILLRLVDEGVYQGNYSLEDSSPHYHMVNFKNEVVRGNAVVLPYSPEYDQSLNPLERMKTIDRVVEQTKGKKYMMASNDIFNDAIPIIQKIDISLPLIFLAILLLMIDILHYRMGLQFDLFNKKNHEVENTNNQQIIEEESKLEAKIEEKIDPFSYAKNKTNKK